jgi:hypothetical protein
MANVTEWLNKIKSAIYGKDVRDAIYNSINSMNSEVVSNTSKQNDLETKYNNQIKNMSLSNPSVAEVVDARTDSKGISYNTLGARLEAEEINSTNNLLRSTGLVKNGDYLSFWSLNTGVSISEELTPNGNRSFYINNSTTTGYFGATQKVPLKSGVTYTLGLFIKPVGTDNEDLVIGLAYKDTSGNAKYHSLYVKPERLTINKWNYIYMTFTMDDATDEDSVNVRAITANTIWHGYVGDFMLVPNKKDMNWGPHPQDLVQQAKTYVDSTYKTRFVKIKPSTDFGFENLVYNIIFNTLVYEQNYVTDTSDYTKVPVDGIYGIKVSLEIYYPGESGTQSCTGDVDILVNGSSVQKHNYCITLENKRACCVTCSFIGKLKANDLIAVNISNNDPYSRTFDFRYDNSWMTIYKI